jgi:hygromycin-B 4-O-kinase
MKTNYKLTDVERFLEARISIAANSLTQLSEGHSSQVICFTSGGKQLVIRIRENEQDLIADKYASEHFSTSLPIPKFLEVGSYDDKAFYCISNFVEGVTVLSLGSDEFTRILPEILDTLAATFSVDITNTHGYGYINIITGEGRYPSYKAFLNSELELLGRENLYKHANKINIGAKLVDNLIMQFENNLRYVSEFRRLTHGDPGGDNMIVKNGEIKGIIDWEQMAYGDWMRDFSRFEFYGDDRYGDAASFAKKYKLETEDLERRKAVYWAISALRDIEFAVTQNNEQVARRLQQDIEHKILLKG